MSLSPMMRHYLEVKEKYKDCIVFYRLGDFYEMFFEDAQEVSQLLDLTLTGRDCGLEERAPMCGIPYHAADTYIAKLVGLGKKVAICEQLTEPGTGAGDGGEGRHPRRVRGDAHRRFAARRKDKQLYRVCLCGGGCICTRVGGYNDGRIQCRGVFRRKEARREPRNAGKIIARGGHMQRRLSPRFKRAEPAALASFFFLLCAVGVFAAPMQRKICSNSWGVKRLRRSA